MALSILDGNQSATTLSTIVTSGQHIPAHTVVSIGTQAITDISGAISGSTVCVGNLGLLQSTVATEGLSASGSFIKIGGHTGTSTTGNIVHVSSVGALRVDGSVYTQPVSIASVTIGNTVTIAGTVTIGNSITIGSLPAISGTVTANILSLPDNANGFFGDGHNNLYSLFESGALAVSPISGTVTIGSALPAGTNQIGTVTASISGTVTANLSNTVTATYKTAIGGVNAVPIVFAKEGANGGEILGYDGANTSLNVNIKGSLPSLVAGTAQIGSVTASISGTVPISISSVTVGNSVTIGSLPAISGTVTANSSNGSLTTRFGSVTTANTAFATSAVTNSNRKYLLIQNITTASNVITVGVGFTPTTTQGIQLAAGAGLTFEGSYIPTGAVNLLSSVTASCFTILEA